MMMNLVKTQDGLNSLNDPSRESFWRAHGKMLFAADSRLKSAGQHRENHWRFLGKNTLVGLSMKGRAYSAQKLNYTIYAEPIQSRWTKPITRFVLPLK